MGLGIGAAIGAVTGIYNAIDGGIKSARANKMAANLKRPTYNIPQGEYSNLNLAASMAGQGMSDSSRQILTNNSDRGLSSSINAILKGGGDPNSINQVYDSYLNNLNNTTLADDAQHIKNVNQYINAQSNFDNDLDKQWQINEYAPYADKAAQIAQLRGQGAAQTNAGIGGIASTAMGYANNVTQQNRTNALALKTSGGTPPGSTPASSPASGGPYSNSNNTWNGYGIDISKLNPSDAGMVNSLLFNQ